MSPLRRRMIEDMQIRNLTANTQRVYVEQVARFARHFRKSPEHLGPAEIRAYLLHLANQRRLAASSIIVTVSALRFFYTITLKRPWVVEDDIPAGKQAKKLPVVMSQDEVARFLAAVDNLKHRVILTVCYATGLRISEAVRLTPDAIDSRRMVIRVVQGKGRKSLPSRKRGTAMSCCRPDCSNCCGTTGSVSVLASGCFRVTGLIGQSLRSPSITAAGRCAHGAASTSRWRRTRCDTPSPFTCWRQAPTCAPSSCCSGTAT